MNTQDTLVSKLPNRVYTVYPCISELNILTIIRKVRESSEFSEEDLEYSRTLGMLFVRPCILPFIDCRALTSPLYSWDGGIFKEIVFSRLEYNFNSEDLPCSMILDLPCLTILTNTSPVKILIDIKDREIKYFSDIRTDLLEEVRVSTGLNKLENYYEKRVLIRYNS